MLRSLALAWLATGCLAPAPALEERFFELPPMVATPVTPPVDAVDRPALSGASVSANASVQRALTWRLSPVEITFDETALWVEEPAKLVRRALEQRLFEIEGFRGSPEDNGLHLWMESLEGDISGAAQARVAFRAVRGEREARIEGSAPLTTRTSEALVFALGAALDNAFDELAAWIWSHAEPVPSSASDRSDAAPSDGSE
ncbi:MAG: hypothetical protein WD226_11430 [Planctomycetota bacterium]